MLPSFPAYPNHESQRLIVALLLALAVHGLVIFSLPFNWRSAGFSDQPTLDLAVAIFEPSGDIGAGEAVKDRGAAEQPPSPPVDQERSTSSKPVATAPPSSGPSASDAGSEPAAAPAASGSPARPVEPAATALQPNPVPTVTQDQSVKPPEPAVAAPQPQTAPPAQRRPIEPPVRSAKPPKPAPALTEKPAPKAAPSPTTAKPTPRQAEREDKTDTAQMTPAKPALRQAEHDDKTGAEKTPPAPPARPTQPQTRQETTAPGLGKTGLSTADAVETTGKPTRAGRPLNSQDLLERGLAMARRDTAAELPEGAPWQRQKNDASMMTLQRFYEESWARQVERSGVIPTEAVQLKLTSGPMLAVVIRANGSVQSITVLRSSGHAAVDEAARAMVYQAAPYAPFPSELRRRTPTLRIVRQWKFKQGRLVSD